MKIALIGTYREFRIFINTQPDIVKNNRSSNIAISETNIYHLISRMQDIQGIRFDSCIYLEDWHILNEGYEIRANIKFCLFKQ